MPPLVPPIQRFSDSLVKAGRRTMPFEIGGLKHQYLCPAAIGWRQLGKDQIKDTVVQAFCPRLLGKEGSADAPLGVLLC